MLANKYRFHGPNSLRYVYRNSKTVHSHIFKIKFATNPRFDHPRFAVVVSKKVHKSAVGRNKIRRRFYEAIRSQLPYIKPGSDIVVTIVSGEALSMPFDELTATIKQLFHEADLYA